MEEKSAVYVVVVPDTESALHELARIADDWWDVALDMPYEEAFKLGDLIAKRL